MTKMSQREDAHSMSHKKIRKEISCELFPVRRITIFGDSIIKRINGKDMGEEAGHSVYDRSFPGYRADAINYHVIPTLYDYDIDADIIHAGTNSLHLNKRNKNEKPQDVTKEIIGIGLTCNKPGVNNIFISSLVLPEHYGMRKKTREINKIVNR